MNDPENKKNNSQIIGDETFEYVKKIVDTVREPFLVLDEKLNVLVANDSFYHTFQLDKGNIEKQSVYEIAKGEWNIPALHELLDKVLPENNFFKGFEITHEFPSIGKKVMIINARHLFKDQDNFFPSLILLAMEDISDLVSVAEKIVDHTNQFEMKIMEIVQKLEINILHLQKELSDMKERLEEV